MARRRRVCLPGLIYHVINRGNNRQAIFLEDEDYEKYLGLVYRYKRLFDFKLFAFCLMTNHVHLLIRAGKRKTIGQIMQSLTNAHTRHYHFKYRTSGHVWQGRFSSPIVSSDDYLLTVMQYIEQNPLRAGVVKSLEDYRWSSYRLNSRLKNSKLIDREENPVYCGLGANVIERSLAYKHHIHRSVEEKDLREIRGSFKNGYGYMSEKFKEQIALMLPKKRKVGRPCKQVNELLVN